MRWHALLTGRAAQRGMATIPGGESAATFNALCGIVFFFAPHAQRLRLANGLQHGDGHDNAKRSATTLDYRFPVIGTRHAADELYVLLNSRY